MPGRTRHALHAAAAAVLVGTLAAAALAGVGRPEVAVVPLEGTIRPALARVFERRLEEARRGRPRFIVVEMGDLDGRDLAPAREMVRALREVPRETETIAYVTDRAFGSAVMVALACDRIAVAPNPAPDRGARLGDVKPWTEGLADEVKTLETIRGYRSRLLRDIVDARGAGDAKASWLGAEEALKEGYARCLAHDRSDLVRLLAAEAGSPIEVREVAGGGIERFLDYAYRKGLLPIFLFLGLLGIAIEIHHPSLFAPGVFGIICLAVALSGGHLAGLTTTLDLALIVTGILLIILEIFVVPGFFGLVGGTGLMCLLAGAFLSMQERAWPQSPEEMAEWRAGAVRFVLGLGATLGAFGLAVRLLPRSPVLNRLIHTGVQRPEDGFTVASAARVALLGQSGIAATDLRPAGKIVISDEVLDAVSEGGWIERGAAIEVIETSLNRLVVRKRQGEAPC